MEDVRVNKFMNMTSRFDNFIDDGKRTVNTIKT